MRLLVVEDDARIADLVRRALAECGYAVDVARDADSAIVAFETEAYDLVVLDIMLPGMARGGIDVCKRIRSTSSGLPVLMLTALDTLAAKVEALDAGADDYVVKPFHVAELTARARALLRRAPRAHPPKLEVRGVTLDPATRSANREGRNIALTAKEYAVLEYLMRNPDTVISSSELIDHAWDRNYIGYSNVVQTYIRYLRKKLVLPGETDIIETRRGSGYIISSRGTRMSE
ncbi:MAG: response regulator transcription factor [Microbacteriaceae bacterium]|nr:MAG: response regulator transcription factor [Microbacteriaceae bacterium]